MKRIYLYKLTTDSGGAPCVTKNLLSLAICKPDIRKMAKSGDIIFGFGGKDFGEPLIYMAEVLKVIPNGDYYKADQGYTRRGDCIYEWKGEALEVRPNSKFHGSEQERDSDVGKSGSHGRNANVVLAKKFVYFGGNANNGYKARFPELTKAVLARMRPYLVNHIAPLKKELEVLSAELFKRYGDMKILGKPRDYIDDECRPKKVRKKCHNYC